MAAYFISWLYALFHTKVLSVAIEHAPEMISPQVAQAQSASLSPAAMPSPAQLLRDYWLFPQSEWYSHHVNGQGNRAPNTAGVKNEHRFYDWLVEKGHLVGRPALLTRCAIIADVEPTHFDKCARKGLANKYWLHTSIFILGLSFSLFTAVYYIDGLPMPTLISKYVDAGAYIHRYQLADRPPLASIEVPYAGYFSPTRSAVESSCRYHEHDADAISKGATATDDVSTSLTYISFAQCHTCRQAGTSERLRAYSICTSWYFHAMKISQPKHGPGITSSLNKAIAMPLQEDFLKYRKHEWTFIFLASAFQYYYARHIYTPLRADYWNKAYYIKTVTMILRPIMSG